MSNKHRNNGETDISLTNYILIGFSSVIALILYYFWAFPYRAVLSYREQLQLFQTTGSYFKDHVGMPGGMAVYIGEFFSQFFNNFWIGAAVMVGLMLLLLLSCYFLDMRYAPSTSKFTSYLLAVIPLISVWLFLGNPDVRISFLIALIITLAFACLFSGTASQFKFKGQYIIMAVGTSLLYWLTGPTTFIFTLLIVIGVFSSRVSTLGKTVFLFVSVAWLAANILIWSATLPYPFSYQLIGIGYMMTPDVLTGGQIIVECICALMPLIALFIGRIPQKITIPTLIAGEVIAIVLLYPKSYDTLTYRLIDYDYMVRTNDWEGIIRYSEQYNPDLPLSVSATNLALGMTGQLDSRAFDYYQHGTEGLLPNFVKEPLSSWTTGEIFFRLGMINSAQRFYFEGMEAIPNYNKSSRAVKRMAEAAIIRGEYVLAQKYLRMLENTLFYRKWAKRNLELLKDTNAVTTHPLYGQLRTRMIDENYLFSEGELDKTLGQLFLKDPGNNLAKQYLILYPLLQRNLDKFMQYMGVVAESQPTYNPLLAQQALAFISMKNRQPVPSGVVSPAVEQSLRDFARVWTSKENMTIEPYRRTLYYYLLSDE